MRLWAISCDGEFPLADSNIHPLLASCLALLAAGTCLCGCGPGATAKGEESLSAIKLENWKPASPDEVRPYTDDSPWNLPIGPNPRYEPTGHHYISQLHGIFGANPNKYASPVYIVSAETPLREVSLSGWWSNVVDDGERLIVTRRGVVSIPIPDGALPAAGKDSNIILWNPESGDEWGFWQAEPGPDGKWLARNGYHYNTKWSGVPPEGFVSGGAGSPYLTGLVRPWELRRGRIDHAIGFAVNYPSSFFIYPATKSDGSAMPPALPEGARLQLDPALTEQDFDRWGLSREGKVIARALQEYGMILTDGSGHPKLSIEYEGTAKWGSLLDKDIVRRIPYSAFKLLSLDAPARPDAPGNLVGELTREGIRLNWQPVASANRYRVQRRPPSGDFFTCADNVVGTTWLDTTLESNTGYEYRVLAVNHNGLSEPSRSVAIAFQVE